MRTMMKENMTANYLFLAEGFEIAEAMCPVDMMTRGGLKVRTVSITEEHLVHSSHGIGIMADLIWSEFMKELGEQKIDGEGVLAFPGGMPGSTNLSKKVELIGIAQRHFDNGGITAAICAAPSVVLGKLNGLKGRKMCCYAGFEKALEDAGVAVNVNDGVVVDKNLITSRGAGHAIAFGLAIVAAAVGQNEAERVAKAIML